MDFADFSRRTASDPLLAEVLAVGLGRGAARIAERSCQVEVEERRVDIGLAVAALLRLGDLEARELDRCHVARPDSVPADPSHVCAAIVTILSPTPDGDPDEAGRIA